MTSLSTRALGILNLERGLQPGESPPNPRPRSFLNPDTFGFPVIFETVEGAWAESVIRGDPTLEPAYIAAARRLVDRGAIAISSNCGFSVRHQAAVASSVNVPVAMSSLLLLPMLLLQVPHPAKIAVITADSVHLKEELLGVDNPAERERVVIGGIEGGQLWQNEMKRPPPLTEVASIEAEVADCIARIRTENPEVAAVLFECTAFPLVTHAIRKLTKLPIYDITTLCRMMFESVF